MKIQIKELNPNPFKKQINKGRLDEEQIKKIQANIKELGLMGSLPVFKKDNKYYLINGHHRLEALKRSFGKDIDVECTLHNYNEQQVLRGMIIENLTQRANEFKEEVENLIVIQNNLIRNKILLDEKGAICPTGGHVVNREQGGGSQPEYGSIRQIVLWLDGNTGEVMKKSKVGDLLSIAKNLSPKILERVEKHSHATGEKEDDIIGVKDATALAKFEDKKEQEDLAEALLKSREQHGNLKTKNITDYKEASEEIKKKVRKGEIDIADVKEEEAYKESKQLKYEETANNVVNDILSNLHDFKHNVDKLLKNMNMKDLSKLNMNKAMATAGLHIKVFKDFVNALRERGAKPHPLIMALIKANGKI